MTRNGEPEELDRADSDRSAFVFGEHKRSEFRSIERPAFVPFDEYRAVRLYRRNLPHWRQAGATYFATFRLADSVPKGVLDQWDHERRLWMLARGVTCRGRMDDWRRQIQRLSATDQYQFHKKFNRLFHAFLDQGHGGCHLSRPECCITLRKELFENDSRTYHLGDFVLMPNHVHLLVVSLGDTELESVLKRIKGASSRTCNQHLNRRGSFWQADSYDHIVRSLEQLASFRQYIADNPAKAGIMLPSMAIYRAPWMDAWFP